MDLALKQRLVGALVLIASGVILIPMLLDGDPEMVDGGLRDLTIPDPPDGRYSTRILPVEPQEPAVSEPYSPAEETPTLEPSLTGMEEHAVADTTAEPTVDPLTEAQVLAHSEVPEPQDERVDADLTANESEQAEILPATVVTDEPAVADESPPDKDQTVHPIPGVGSGWYVQIGSFTKRTNADKLSERLRSGDFLPSIDRVTIAGREIYRVRLGPLAEKSAAKELQHEIKRMFGEVTPHLVEAGDIKAVSSASDDATSSSATSAWVVQVGSFGSQANATKLRDQLRGGGLSAFVETVTVQGKSAYRVRVGPETSKKRAQAAQQKVKEQFGVNGFVTRHP